MGRAHSLVDRDLRPSARAPVHYVICLGAFLSNLSAGMFNIALVDIAGEFRASLSSAQWIVTVYLLVISVCLPLMGKLGDLVGRTKVHNTGYLIFVLGALACAFAPSLGWLVGFRLLQGFGASMYQATNMALIVSVFPPGKRGQALGLMSTFVAAGSMIGPSLGGVLIEWFSWRASFGLLAAVGFAAWLLAERMIPREPATGQARLDLTGAGLFAAALTGFASALSLSGTQGFASWPVLLLLALAGLFLALFLRHSRQARWNAAEGREPFLPVALFRHAGVSAGILITVVTYLAAFSAQLVLPVFLRSELGLSAAAAGFCLMAYPLALILAAPLFGRLSDKHGVLPILAAGMQLMTAALLALGFLSPAYPLALLLALIVLLGASMGMITSPNNSLVMRETPPEHLGIIGSILALSRNLGMMFGTVAGGGLLAAGSGAPALHGYRSVFAVCCALVAGSFLLTVRSTRQRHRREESVSS
ncbi:MFS transporter [Gorillibacterium sp. sgz500922]|uniref:MFS transporter n=1 Tax=Gorillibacterium sp. sgz500922 TaxID=3446694 RepID=UPI003F66FA87